MTSKTVELNSLADALRYFGEHRTTMPLFVIEDDKGKKEKTRTPHEVQLAYANEEAAEILQVSEEKKLGVFFYPNGATKDMQIKEIRWHFVDIDHGEKEEQYAKILSAPLQPTLVYRGRAGHKVLYRIKDATWSCDSSESIQESIAHFKNIQQQLIEFFQGDLSVVNPAHALRLPLVGNYKYWEKQVYTEEIVFFQPDNVYSQQELKDAFPEAERKHLLRKNSKEYSEQTGKVNDLIQSFINRLEMEMLSYIDYGERIAFQCPVHNDASPSAFMYKDNLVVHCSKGRAEGGCAIDHGKSLGWVAEHEAWDEVFQLWDELNRNREVKYQSIDIDSMCHKEEIALTDSFDSLIPVVEGVLQDINEVMETRGLPSNPELEMIYKNLTYHSLIKNSATTCATLIPGGGKSTWMVSFNRYRLKYDIQNAGTILVTERIETAKKLAADIGNYEMIRIGPGIDIEHEQEFKSALVLESAYTSDSCEKEIPSYTYGICRGCDFYLRCDTAQQLKLQRKYPIVIMTHARLVMEKQNLGRYATWIDPNGIEHKREILIIDEKPPVASVYTITLKFVQEFEREVERLGCLTPIKEVLGKVKGVFTQFQEGGEVNAYDPEFRFDFREQWYKHYSGKNVSLLEWIELLIREGGTWQQVDNKVKISVHETNDYDFSNYTTLVLDGTSSFDMEYSAMKDVGFLEAPSDIRTYENLTLNIADLSLSKSKLRRNVELLEGICNEVQTLCLNKKVLVLCFKEDRQRIEALLSSEIRLGRVFVNHYGNVKGSNDYICCTALVLAGMLHKGDPYYISKYTAIYGKPDKDKTVTINSVRRFTNIDLERYKLNDQLTALIQDIFRTSLRTMSNTQSVDVFIPTRDKILTELLRDYFKGSLVRDWKIEGITPIPDWYNALDEALAELEPGQTISKKHLRLILHLEGDAGEKKFRRIEKESLFKELLCNHSVDVYNAQKYRKGNHE